MNKMWNLIASDFFGVCFWKFQVTPKVYQHSKQSAHTNFILASFMRLPAFQLHGTDWASTRCSCYFYYSKGVFEILKTYLSSFMLIQWLLVILLICRAAKKQRCAFWMISVQLKLNICLFMNIWATGMSWMIYG